MILLALGLVLVLVLVTVIFVLPSWIEKKRIERLEEEFSLFLRLCSVHSSFQSFEKALGSAASGFNELGLEFSRVLNEVRAGKPLPMALRVFALKTPSLMIQRACMQLCFSYAHGDRQALTRLSEEFDNLQRARLKRFASKTMVLSAWFVTLSCLVPALFSAYAIIGSALLSFSLSSEIVLTTLAVGFPTLSAFMVAYVIHQTPGVRL